MEVIDMGENRFKPLVLLCVTFLSISLIGLAAKAVGAMEIAGTIRARGVKNPADVVLYIEKVAGQFQPPQIPLVIDLKKMTFIPHALPVVVGSSVKFVNHDAMEHHAMALQKKQTIFDLALPPGSSSVQILRQIGLVTILDNVHPEMSAYIVVLQNPFFAKPDEKGNYTIENVPPGIYTLKAWHEKLKPESKKVKVSAGSKVQVDFELRP